MRTLYIVDSMQVVTSTANPQGVFSHADGYPKNFDSRSYNATQENPNGDSARALEVAEADYLRQVASYKDAGNPNRTMWSVTLTRADGRQIRFDTKGQFPDMTPTPEPEPEPEPEAEPVEQ